MLSGGVCGSGKIKYSFNSGTITAKGKFAMDISVGGCLGKVDKEGIQGCYNTGNIVSLVEATGTGSYNVGGVVGTLINVHGQDCYSIGNVTAEKRSSCWGYIWKCE